MDSSNEDFDEEDDADNDCYTSEENKTDRKEDDDNIKIKSEWCKHKKVKNYTADEDHHNEIKMGSQSCDQKDKYVQISPKGRFGRVYKILYLK